MKIRKNTAKSQMLSQIFHKHGDVFFKTFLALSALSILPIICIALAFLGQSSQFWKSEQYRSSERTLDRFVKQVDDRLLAAESDCIRLSSNPSVLSFIINPTFSEIGRNQLVMKSLQDIEYKDNGIKLAYLYSNFSNIVLTAEEKGYDYLHFYDQDALNYYSKGVSENFVVRKTNSRLGEQSTFISIYKNVPANSTGSLGGIIFNIEQGWLFSGGAQADVLQINTYAKDSSLLYAQNPDESMYQLSPEFKKTLAQNSSSFIYKHGKDALVILQTTSRLTGWHYIASIPLPLFYQGSRNIARTILIFSTVSLLICIILSFTMTRRLYRPLKSLLAVISGQSLFQPKTPDLPKEYQYIHDAYSDILQENRTMASALDAMRPTIKNSFFFSLLLGERISNDELRSKLAFIDENFTLSGYGVLFLQIDQYDTYLKQFNEIDRSMHGYRFSGIVEKIVLSYPFTLIKVKPSAWGLALNTGKCGEDILPRIADEIQNWVSNSLPFTVTIGIGHIYDYLGDLSHSYYEAQESLRFHLYKNDGRADQIENIKESQKTYYLNTKLEEALLNSVRTGDTIEVEKVCLNIYRNMRDSAASYNDVFMVCTQILNGAFELIISLGGDLRQIYGTRDCYSELGACKTVGDIQILMKQICFLAAQHIEKRNKERWGRNIERLTEFIQSHLGEDISLKDLADYSGMNPTYISRLFKERLNIGFLEYLNTHRITRAKQLLKETLLTVDQVGFQVGFNNVRSFMRTFKQYEGTTPGQYRNTPRE